MGLDLLLDLHSDHLGVELSVFYIVRIPKMLLVIFCRLMSDFISIESNKVLI